MDKYPRRSLEDVRAERRAVSNSTVTFSTPTKPRFVNKWSSKPMNNLKPYITKATQKPESQEEKEWFRRNENSLTPIQIPQVTTSSKEPHTSLDSNNLSAELRSFSYAIQELKDQVLSLKQAMDEQSEQVLSHRKQLWAMRKKLDGTWQADEDFVKSRQ